MTTRKRSVDAFPWLRDSYYVRARNYTQRKRGPGRIHKEVPGAPGNGLLGYWKRYGFRGDSPGGLGPTPKGEPGPIRIMKLRPQPIVLPWANAEDKRERARRLRQMGRVTLEMTMLPTGKR